MDKLSKAEQSFEDQNPGRQGQLGSVNQQVSKQGDLSLGFPQTKKQNKSELQRKDIQQGTRQLRVSQIGQVSQRISQQSVFQSQYYQQLKTTRRAQPTRPTSPIQPIHKGIIHKMIQKSPSLQNPSIRDSYQKIVQKIINQNPSKKSIINSQQQQPKSDNKQIQNSQQNRGTQRGNQSQKPANKKGKKKQPLLPTRSSQRLKLKNKSMEPKQKKVQIVDVSSDSDLQQVCQFNDQSISLQYESKDKPRIGQEYMGQRDNLSVINQQKQSPMSLMEQKSDWHYQRHQNWQKNDNTLKYLLKPNNMTLKNQQQPGNTAQSSLSLLLNKAIPTQLKNKIIQQQKRQEPKIQTMKSVSQQEKIISSLNQKIVQDQQQNRKQKQKKQSIPTQRLIQEQRVKYKPEFNIQEKTLQTQQVKNSTYDNKLTYQQLYAALSDISKHYNKPLTQVISLLDKVSGNIKQLFQVLEGNTSRLWTKQFDCHLGFIRQGISRRQYGKQSFQLRKRYLAWDEINRPQWVKKQREKQDRQFQQMIADLKSRDNELILPDQGAQRRRQLHRQRIQRLKAQSQLSHSPTPQKKQEELQENEERSKERDQSKQTNKNKDISLSNKNNVQNLSNRRKKMKEAEKVEEEKQQ